MERIEEGEQIPTPNAGIDREARDLEALGRELRRLGDVGSSIDAIGVRLINGALRIRLHVARAREAQPDPLDRLASKIEALADRVESALRPQEVQAEAPDTISRAEHYDKIASMRTEFAETIGRIREALGAPAGEATLAAAQRVAESAGRNDADVRRCADEVRRGAITLVRAHLAAATLEGSRDALASAVEALEWSTTKDLRSKGV